jgi:hypothetical protein
VSLGHHPGIAIGIALLPCYLPFIMRASMRRPLALLLGLWFLIAGQEPPFPHPCEMDGANALATGHLHAESQRTASSDPANQHTDHHADHHADHDGAPVEAAVEAPDDAPASSLCECVDDCCVTVVAVTAIESVSGLVRITPSVSRQIPAVAARAIDVAPRLLPFAQAPPALV